VGERNEHFDDATQRRVRASPHVQRLHRQPHGIDPYHRSRSRSQAAHSVAAAAGQRTLMVVPARCNSMQMLLAAGAGNAMGTKPFIGNGAASCEVGGTPSSRRSASCTHLRSMFALSPLASATAAIEMPGCLQASITEALNAALWRLRVRRAGAAIVKVSMCPRRVKRTRGSYGWLGRSR